VTGVDFDQRLHSAERLNVLALQLRREGLARDRVSLWVEGEDLHCR
jgi:hypothetical protein